MNTAQVNNLIQQILSILGGLLVGLGVTSDTTWQTVVGIITGLAAAYWAFKSHTLTGDSLAGTLKQLLQFVGSFLVTKGIIDPAKLNIIIGAVISAATLIIDQISHATPTPPAPPAV